MVPEAGFWQNRSCMQNASEAGAESSILAPSTPKIPPVASDPSTLEPPRVPEIGGPPGPEPTRYGDWEKKGRCIDF
jgi:hypothetical protein